MMRFVVLLSLLLFSGCAMEMNNNTPIYQTGREAIYYATISTYCTPGRLAYSYCGSKEGEFFYWIDIVGNQIASVADVIEQTNRAERYFELQERYNDYPKHPMTLYEWTYDGWLLPPYHVMIYDLIKVDIIALEDWNDHYPKGTLLNSIFKLSYYSPKNYIESGFTTDANEMFVCNVEDIPNKPIELISCMQTTYLTTTELPTVARPDVHIKYYFSNGSILEQELTLSD